MTTLALDFSYVFDGDSHLFKNFCVWLSLPYLPLIDGLLRCTIGRAKLFHRLLAPHLLQKGFEFSLSDGLHFTRVNIICEKVNKSVDAVKVNKYIYSSNAWRPK
jgi:hypothetical protein